MDSRYVIGVDFGTDSARALLVNARNGETCSTSVAPFKRWAKGWYCEPSENRFRQHPLDYIESLERCIVDCLAKVNPDVRAQIVGISIDSTGSTPVAVDQKGHPLALQERFSENPNAMFFLWKDHTSILEAEEINSKAKDFDINYLNYCGGAYSSEWFWSKLLHVSRADPIVFQAAHSWVEQSDWLPYLLTGGQDAAVIKRNVCAAGHKALWAKEHGGYPPLPFFDAIDESLARFHHSLGHAVYTAQEIAGHLSEGWAEKLGLSSDIVIGVGAIDAHVGAIGAQIETGYMCKVMGTSTCDMMVVSNDELQDRLVEGICGQVQGSIVPSLVGLEAGQSAFGDVYSWFKDLLLWPLLQQLEKQEIDRVYLLKLTKQLEGNLLRDLSELAKQQPVSLDAEYALDWFNGRRTPNVDPHLKAGLFNLNLGTTPVRIFQALVESTCFGSRAIVEHMETQGVRIKGVIGIGGIAKKSDYVMQTLADVLQRPIKIHASEETCALGASMLAATVADVHSSLAAAMKAMGPGFEKEYHPDLLKKDLYDSRYARYLTLDPNRKQYER
ncbi:MAG: ribulokinase [Sphingobacterium sp.]